MPRLVLDKRAVSSQGTTCGLEKLQRSVPLFGRIIPQGMAKCPIFREQVKDPPPPCHERIYFLRGPSPESKCRIKDTQTLEGNEAYAGRILPPSVSTRW